MPQKLYKQPNNENDWSDVDEVVVVYPAITLIVSHHKKIIKKERTPKRIMTGRYHGRTYKNTNLCIVEDSNGIVHIVNKNIVFFR